MVKGSYRIRESKMLCTTEFDEDDELKGTFTADEFSYI